MPSTYERHLPFAEIVLLVLFIVLPPGVGAQPSGADTDQSDRRSPVRAGLYSAGGTVLPIASGAALLQVADDGGAVLNPGGVGALLVVGGLVGGPAIGHFYAEDRRQATIGLWVRGGATAVGTGAVTVIALDFLSNDLFALKLPQQSRTKRIAARILVGAIIVAAGSAVFDIVTAPLSARAFNGAQGSEERDLRVDVAPRLDLRHRQAGLSIQVGL